MREKILEALARGYCDKCNEQKTFDAYLITSMAEEVEKLFESLQLRRK